MCKVGIITLYRGYNYGTSLQAYALKRAIRDLGYDTEILWTNENTHAGRDIRIEKIVRMAARMLVHPELRKNTIRGYKKSLGTPIDEHIKEKFKDFEENELSVKGLSMQGLRKFARDAQTVAVVCGSDQIWSAAGANVEPLYYLRFAPVDKRVAYAPSFGASKVPAYNQKLIKKYIAEIPNVSVREKQGAKIVFDLIKREVPVVLDPTLLVDWNQWGNAKKIDYFLLYFLSEPSENIIDKIAVIAKSAKCKVIALPYRFGVYSKINDIGYPNVGPKEFVELIRNAKCVYTDSFHGTIFSINLNVPFWTIARNYGNGIVEQSSRITSILETFNLSGQYICNDTENKLSEMPSLDFGEINLIRKEEKEKSLEYLKKALGGKNRSEKENE